jgi:hypothetical protein
MSDDQLRDGFFDWLKEGNSGCLFARILAFVPNVGKWKTVIVRRAFSDDTPSVLHDFLSSQIGVSEAVTFLFPGVRTPEEILRLIGTLCIHPNWHCVELISESKASETILVGLRWVPSLTESNLVNWIIGFSDIASMPPTRKAPHTAIVIRIGAPGKNAGIRRGDPKEPKHRKKENDRIPVHVADVSVFPPLKSEKKLVELWNKTVEEKQRRLGDSQVAEAARAKVTFSLPKEFQSRIQKISSHTINI